MNNQTHSFGHYIPQFILRYFLEGNFIHVYNRKENSYKKKSPKVIAGEKGYYVFTDKRKKKNDSIEKMFQQIETHAAVIVKNLHEGKTTMTEQEKADLGMFLASQYTRIPDFFRKSETMSIEGTKEIMKRSLLMSPDKNKSFDKFEQKTGIKMSEEEREFYKKMIINKTYNVKFPKGYFLKHMILLMQDFYKYMFQMEWFIFKAPEQKAFITSDNPVFTYNPKPEGFWGSGIGLLALNCETTAVLTPKIVIYLSQKYSPSIVKFFDAPSDLVDTINGRTAICSSNLVFSHSLLLLKRWIERLRLWERPIYSQIKVG